LYKLPGKTEYKMRKIIRMLLLLAVGQQLFVQVAEAQVSTPGTATQGMTGPTSRATMQIMPRLLHLLLEKIGLSLWETPLPMAGSMLRRSFSVPTIM
jgi:hypothetical protein